MSMRLPLLASGLLLASVWADPAEETEEAFLNTPWTKPVSGKQHVFPTADLPKPLMKLIMQWSDSDASNANLPAEIRGFVFDLNQDGRNEYFIDSPTGGGSGGPLYYVYTEVEGRWRLIGDFQGSLAMFPAGKGKWPRLLRTSRGGGFVWTKTYSEFKDGQYHETLREHFDRGTITRESLPRK